MPVSHVVIASEQTLLQFSVAFCILEVHVNYLDAHSVSTQQQGQLH